MHEAASHIGDIATQADDDTNRKDDARDYVDDMEMVETTFSDDELETAWREDSDDSAKEDPYRNIRGREKRIRRIRQSNLVYRKRR